MEKPSSGVSMNTEDYTRIVKSMGRDAIVGKDRFFEMTFYWVFICEKSDTLIASLESMKAAELVYPFLNKAHFSHAKYVSAAAKRINKESRCREEASLNDPAANLFLEVGFLYLYGILMSAFGALFEFIVGGCVV